MPHSEIDGSKPILGSSSLIAEYHVLHRLLLPRHPPNALLALDLIQRKTGYPATHTLVRCVLHPLIKSILSRSFPLDPSCHWSAAPLGRKRTKERFVWPLRVSVLDLEISYPVNLLRSRPSGPLRTLYPPPEGHRNDPRGPGALPIPNMKSMCISLYDVNSSKLDGKAVRLNDQV